MSNLRVRGYLFIKPIKERLLYRKIGYSDPCYESEIDSKCRALPEGKEFKIPICIKLDRDLPKLIHSTHYTDLPSELGICFNHVHMDYKHGWHFYRRPNLSQFE